MKRTLRDEIGNGIRQGKFPIRAGLFRQLEQFQISKNPIYRAWRKSGHGVCMPIIAFQEDAVVSFPIRKAKVVFQSSGTTSRGKQSRHYMQDLNPYQASVQKGWEWFLGIQNSEFRMKNGKKEKTDGKRMNLRFIALMPSAKEAPQSSLSRMLDILMKSHGRGDDAWLMKNGQWQWPMLVKYLHQIQESPVPAVLFGTAFAWVHFIDWCHDQKTRFKLPRNTLLLETGGYKGRSRELSREKLHRSLMKLLGVGLAQIFSEYSMCELSSQAYSFRKGKRLLFQFPPWCRHQVARLNQAGLARKGEPGVLEIMDLANVDSCGFIRTGDMAVDHGDGFEWMGRLPKAGLKGCSLGFE